MNYSSEILQLPCQLISIGMVLQQGQSNRIWGLAPAQRSVVVMPSWLDQALEVKANQDGHWIIDLQPPPAGGPYELRLNQDNQEINITDILCGEVWLASGQSNMEMPILGSDYFENSILDADKHIAEAQFQEIRIFTVAKKLASESVKDVGGVWTKALPETVGKLSAVSYFFARSLHHELKVPIGIINTAWSATAIESWSSPESNTRLGIAYAFGQPEDLEPAYPSALYWGMIHPLRHYAIRGVIWYQGESNIAWAEAYREQFTALIADWRSLLQNSDLPFYFVQLAPYNHEIKGQMPALREAQAQTFNKVPNTGMVVTTDLGDLEDVHPVNKAPVGQRLALWALARTYDKTDIVYAGPHFRSLQREGSSIRVQFETWSLGSGLRFDSEPGREFELGNAEGNWFQAEARIDGQTLVVHSDQVNDPVRIRFSWSDTATAILFNLEGLPATPFSAEIEQKDGN